MAAGHRPGVCELTAGSIEQYKPLLALSDGADTRDKDRVRRDLTAAERGAQTDAAQTLGNQKLLVEAANLSTGTREGRPGRAGTVAYGETVAQTADIRCKAERVGNSRPISSVPNRRNCRASICASSGGMPRQKRSSEAKFCPS